MFINDRLEHPRNTLVPIVVIVLGKDTEIREVQFSNANASMEVSGDEIQIEVILVQPLNELIPIETMEHPQLIDVKLLLFVKA